MILKLIPVFKAKIWGGLKLQQEFRSFFQTNSTQILGEAWIISGYPNSETGIKNHNQTLNKFYKTNKNLFNNYQSINFPLLVKLIDANQNLSIQVHPNDEQAKRLEGSNFLGKLEAWYILETKNKQIILGTKQESKQVVKSFLKDNKINSIISYQTIKQGDVFEITPGTLHAIMAGTLIYEVQQSSDLTYRFYDYDRIDTNGNKRELHLDKSLEVLRFDQINKKHPIIKHIGTSKIERFIKNNKFVFEKWTIIDKLKISLKKERNFLLITSIKGSGIINNTKLNKFESVILTVDELSNITIIGNIVLLIANPC